MTAEAPDLFRQLGEGRYAFIPQHGILFEVDRLRRDRHELIGELTVQCDLAGARVLDPQHTIARADFNVSSARARLERARLLADRSQTTEIDWTGLVEAFCVRVLQAERTGAPVIHLRDVPCPAPDEDLEVDGFTLLPRHPVVLFGDGGAAKSYLGLYAGGQLARRGRRVLFVDWEFAAEDHRVRLERLFPEMPDLFYVRCERPLVAEADRLRRIVRDEGIEYLVYDSIAFACDGPPEAADVASAYYRATRSIGGGSLHLAHITKADGGEYKPFGSAFWHNGARMTWYAKLAEEAPDGQQITVGLYNRKSNMGPTRPALGFEFTFDETRTVVRRVDLADVADLAAKAPLWQRMAGALRTGPLKLVEIAEEIDAKVDSVEKVVTRSKGRLFTRMAGADGVTRISLVARRAEPWADTCPQTYRTDVPGRADGHTLPL